METYFFIKDEVYARVYTNTNYFCWKFGKVIERIVNVRYNVLLKNGKLIRVHANQIKIRYGDLSTIEMKHLNHKIYPIRLIDPMKIWQKRTIQVKTMIYKLLDGPDVNENQLLGILLDRFQKKGRCWIATLSHVWHLLIIFLQYYGAHTLNTLNF